MKKIVCMFLAICMVFLCACSSDNADWKTITIDKCGTLKIPNEWDFVIKENTMCVMKNNTPIVVSYERTGEFEQNYFLSDFKYLEFIDSAVFSNGAIYGKAEYSYSNQIIERYYLYLGETTDGKWVEFIFLDEQISKNMVKKIAKTFVSE